MKKVVYLDNAATTPVRAEALAAMMRLFGNDFGNPASHYRFATVPHTEVQEARARVASVLGAVSEEEIYFTCGGTESDNWAIRGVAEANSNKGLHIITSAFEHHAVIESCKDMQSRGFEVTFVNPTKSGTVEPADIEAAIRPDTVLISVMAANNEVGSIQPITDIGAIARSRGILFHTDAVQAVGHIPIDVEAMNIDLLSLSAHKFYGPKGAGVLYIRKGTKIKPILFGGMQEWNKRAGTHNVPGIVGLSTALEHTAAEMASEAERLSKMRDRLAKGILSRVPFCKLNGGDNRLPGSVNISFRFIESESILNLLDFKNICASSGSACNSDALEPSHVLLSLGLSHEEANGTVRFTLGRYNTENDIDAVLEALPPIIEKLRNMSPLYEDFVKSGMQPR